MDVSLYSAAAAMNATERWQDLVADNLSLASVPGARMKEISFSAVQAGLSSAGAGAAVNNFVMPYAGATTNFGQGELKATGGNLDLALEGPGFFTVTMPDGSKGYTRDGEFKLNSQGQLVTKQGFLVVGDGGGLQFDPNNRAPLNISPSGEVSQGPDTKGKLALTEFGNLKALTVAGSGFFYADPTVAQAAAGKTTGVRQGFVEASNASPTLAMASLVNSMRMFESNQKVMVMQGERMSKTISELSGTA
jgi:flagellar basal-body rod protein FlgF